MALRYCCSELPFQSDTEGFHSHTSGGYARSSAAVLRSESVSEEALRTPMVSDNASVTRLSAATIPRWKFGMSSKRAVGEKNGSLGVQPCPLTSRSMRAATAATAPL